MKFNVVAIQMVKERSATYDVDSKTITGVEDIAEVLEKFFETADREQVIAVCLNSKNKILCINTVSTGSLNSSVIHPREVFKAAILSNAAAIIVAHNHPSGNPIPSEEDKKLTNTLFSAGKIIGIPVLDHLIIGDYYYSFKEHSLI